MVCGILRPATDYPLQVPDWSSSIHSLGLTPDSTQVARRPPTPQQCMQKTNVGPPPGGVCRESETHNRRSPVPLRIRWEWKLSKAWKKSHARLRGCTRACHCSGAWRNGRQSTETALGRRVESRDLATRVAQRRPTLLQCSGLFLGRGVAVVTGRRAPPVGWAALLGSGRGG